MYWQRRLNSSCVARGYAFGDLWVDNISILSFLRKPSEQAINESSKD